MTTAVPTHPRIPGSRYSERLARLAALVADRGLAAALIGVGPDLDYLTGYRAMALERLTMLAVVAGEAPVLVVPRLEEPAARAGLRTDIEIATWMETDDPHGLVAGLVERARGRAAATIAVSDRLWSLHLLRLQSAAPGARWIFGDRGPARAPNGQGRRRDRAAPPGRGGGRSGRRPDRLWPAHRADGGGRRPRGARAAPGRGPRTGRVRDRRLRDRTRPLPTTRRRIA